MGRLLADDGVNIVSEGTHERIIIAASYLNARIGGKPQIDHEK